MYGRLTAFAAALSAGLLLAQGAAARLDYVEEGFESSTLEVRIPAANNASIKIRHCSTCPTIILRITPQTRFFIGKQPVSQIEFRQAANRTTAFLMVHYEPESKDVTRLVMSAA